MQVLNILKSASSLSRSLVGNVTTNAGCSLNSIVRNFTQMSLDLKSQPMLSLESPLSSNSVRHKKQPRDYFPKANERKRLLKHGFLVRMSTPAGRRIIMRRILKGTHVLSH